jgi:hypothetical protein
MDAKVIVTLRNLGDGMDYIAVKMRGKLNAISQFGLLMGRAFINLGIEKCAATILERCNGVLMVSNCDDLFWKSAPTHRHRQWRFTHECNSEGRQPLEKAWSRSIKVSR